MKKQLLGLFLLLLCWRPGFGQEEKAAYELTFSVAILDQPDCPLKIVEVGVQNPRPGIVYMWFTVQNQSDKPVVMWRVQGLTDEGLVMGGGAGPDESQLSAHSLVVLKPGEEDTHGRLSSKVLQQIVQSWRGPAGLLRELRVKLAVVKVVFADGTKYDATERLRALGWKPLVFAEPKT